MATSISTAAASAMAAALNTYFGSSADIVIYDGTPPANANAALSSNNVLVSFDLASTPFTNSNGVLTLDVDPALTEAATASGTATFFRILVGGTTSALQGTVGTSGAQLNLNTTAITSSVNVTITSGTVTVPTA